MNNEEKILSMLENLTSTVSTLVTKVDKLEQGQAKLEQGQAKLERDLKEVKEQQKKDSGLLQAVFDQTAKLTEHKTETEAKFEKIKAIL
ncbi:MAG: hypothetical protein ACOWWO_16830 [Peptococcaceae bacterium]